MIIREALDNDLENVLSVHRAAFGSDEEAGLVNALLTDNSAGPVVSLLAMEDDIALGHILFTRARIEPDAPLSIYILAPLAVMPDSQKTGVGTALAEKGMQVLSDAGAQLVFVLGHPAYYPRFGFSPAGELGFEATYPILEKNADAWMVRELVPHIIGKYSGKVICADTMNRPEYWAE